MCVFVCRCAFVFVYLVYHGFHYGCGCVSFALRWLMSPFDFENVNLLSSSASLSSILIHVLNAKRLDCDSDSESTSRRWRWKWRWRWRRRLSTCQLRWLVISIWIIKLLLMRLLLLLPRCALLLPSLFCSFFFFFRCCFCFCFGFDGRVRFYVAYFPAQPAAHRETTSSSSSNGSRKNECKWITRIRLVLGNWFFALFSDIWRRC